MENYVSSYYDSEDYNIRCDTKDNSLHVTVQQFGSEPDLEELVSELFQILDIRKKESGENDSYLNMSKMYENMS